MFLATVHGQSRSHAIPVKTSIEGGLSICVPAVDTGTQLEFTFSSLETSNPDHCPAVHAESLHNFNHMSLDQLEAKDMFQVTRTRLVKSLD